MLSSSPNGDGWKRIATLLGRLRDQLAWHFALEEKAGFVEDIVRAAPRLSTEALRLQDEHESLFIELSSLADLGAAAVNSDVPLYHQLLLRQRFFDFQQHLQQHDDREDELMMESLYLDIGGSE